jgi:quinol monooxygenase YgiN
MIVVHTSIPIDPECRAEAVEAAEVLAEHSRKEKEMVAYRAMTVVEKPNVIRFFEQYDDVAALEAHVETDYYRAFEDELPDFVDGKIETRRFQADEAETIRFDVDELGIELDAGRTE